jgi:hypothetical protein
MAKAACRCKATLSGYLFLGADNLIGGTKLCKVRAFREIRSHGSNRSTHAQQQCVPPILSRKVEFIIAINSCTIDDLRNKVDLISSLAHKFRTRPITAVRRAHCFTSGIAIFGFVGILVVILVTVLSLLFTKHSNYFKAPPPPSFCNGIMNGQMHPGVVTVPLGRSLHKTNSF